MAAAEQGHSRGTSFVGTLSMLQTRVRATYWLKQSKGGPGPGMVLVALGHQGLVGAGWAAWVLLAPPEPPTGVADPGQVWVGHKPAMRMADALPAGLSLWPLSSLCILMFSASLLI